MLIKLFKIKNKITIFLTSVALIAMPAMSEILTYWYCSDSYCMSILLSILAVYILYNYKNKWGKLILASSCLTFSMALYQTSIGITVTLCIMLPIFEILKGEKNTKEILKEIGNSLIMGMVAGIIYFGLTHIILKLYNISLSSYGGANKIGISNLTNIFTYIKTTYITFYNYYFKNNIVQNYYWRRQYINVLFIILIGISFILLIVKNKSYKKKWNMILLVVFMLILPICLGIIEVIAPERGIALLMSSPYIFPVIMLILLIEVMTKKEQYSSTINIFEFGSIFITICILWTYILSNNATYMAIKMTKNQLYSYSVRILDRIETNEEYIKDMPIMFAGDINKEQYPRDSIIYSMANGGTAKIDALWHDYNGSKQTWSKFFISNLGTNVKWCTNEQYKAIIQTDEFKKMGLYPATNSVKVINNIMVVKFTNNPPKP